MQIEHGRATDFTCAHCGAVYEMSESPAHDTGSAACEVCNMVLKKWVDAPIPLFRAKSSIEDARRRYLLLGSDSTVRRTAS
jgi:NAD-dependent SIR2 family protein deacetylase